MKLFLVSEYFCGGVRWSDIGPWVNLGTAASNTIVYNKRDVDMVYLGFTFHEGTHSHLLYGKQWQVSGGRLNKKDGLTRYGNSHVKDKTS